MVNKFLTSKISYAAKCFRVQKFTSTGELAEAWGESGFENGQLDHPIRRIRLGAGIFETTEGNRCE
jgi:hypothetical protein